MEGLLPLLHIAPIPLYSVEMSSSTSPGRADGELQDERSEDAARTQPAATDTLYQDDGQQVGHRVIAAALQLQHGAKIVFEVDFLGTQDIEHRRGVGGGHGGSQQQGGEQAETDACTVLPSGKPVCEHTRQKGCHQHAEGGEGNTGSQYRADIPYLRLHTTREKYDAQDYHPDVLGDVHIVELQPDTVRSEQHAGNEEHQKGRYAEAVTRPADKDTAKHQKCHRQ